MKLSFLNITPLNLSVWIGFRVNFVNKLESVKPIYKSWISKLRISLLLI
jgi:hypothetical protein